MGECDCCLVDLKHAHSLHVFDMCFNYQGVGRIIAFMVIMATIQTAEAQLQEQLETSNSECFGSGLEITPDCGSSAYTIAIKNLIAGSKPTSTGCLTSWDETVNNDTTCCIPNTTVDCTITIDNIVDNVQLTATILSCNGRDSSCFFQALNRPVNQTACPEGRTYLPTTNYMYCTFYCIESLRIHGIGGDNVQASGYNTTLYVRNDNDPISAGFSTTQEQYELTVESSDTMSGLKLHTIQRDLASGVNITAQDEDGNILVEWSSDNNTYNLETITTTSHFITITIKNNVSDSKTRWWMGFEATNISTLTMYYPPQVNTISDTDSVPMLMIVLITVGVVIGLVLMAVSVFCLVNKKSWFRRKCFEEPTEDVSENVENKKVMEGETISIEENEEQPKEVRLTVSEMEHTESGNLDPAPPRSPIEETAVLPNKKQATCPVPEEPATIYSLPNTPYPLILKDDTLITDEMIESKTEDEHVQENENIEVVKLPQSPQPALDSDNVENTQAEQLHEIQEPIESTAEEHVHRNENTDLPQSPQLGLDSDNVESTQAEQVHTIQEPTGKEDAVLKKAPFLFTAPTAFQAGLKQTRRKQTKHRKKSLSRRVTPTVSERPPVVDDRNKSSHCILLCNEPESGPALYPPLHPARDDGQLCGRCNRRFPDALDYDFHMCAHATTKIILTELSKRHT